MTAFFRSPVTSSRLCGVYLDEYKARCQRATRLALLVLLTFLPGPLMAATDAELTEIAHELAAKSVELADARRYSQSFFGLSQRASRLAREAGLLIDSMRRTRNSAAISSRFSNISKRYTDLEDVYWRRSRDHSDNYVANQLTAISALYSELSGAFYTSRYFQDSPSVVIFAAPTIGDKGSRVPPVLLNGLVDSSIKPGEHSRFRVTVPDYDSEPVSN